MIQYWIAKSCFLFQDKLLTKLEENEPELATSQEDEVKYIQIMNRFSLLYTMRSFYY